MPVTAVEVVSKSSSSSVGVTSSSSGGKTKSHNTKWTVSKKSKYDMLYNVIVLECVQLLTAQISCVQYTLVGYCWLH